MSFLPDSRGVSEVLGSILVFGLVMMLLVSVQVAGVPAANEKIEFEHNARVQADLQTFDGSVDRAAAIGASDSVAVETGVRYPTRLFLLNPGPTAGTLSTTGPESVTIGNVEAIDAETADFLTGDLTFDSVGLEHAPSYNEYTTAPVTRYEHGVLYNTDGGQSAVFADGNVVSGDRISLTLLEGSVSASSSSAVSLDVTPVSGPSTTVSVTDDGSPITITLYTGLSETDWQTRVLADEWDPSDSSTSRHVRDAQCDGQSDADADEPCNGPLTITLDDGVTYDLRLAKVGVGSGASSPAPAYLTTVGSKASVLDEQGTEFTVEIRDEFNAPMSGEPISFSVTGAGTITGDATQTTDESGSATVTVTPSGTQAIDVVAFYDPNENGVLDAGEDVDPFVVRYDGLAVPEKDGGLKDINDASKDVVLDSVTLSGKDTFVVTFENQGSSDYTFTEGRISFVLATDDPTLAVVTEGGSTIGTLPVRGDFVDITDVTIPDGASNTATLSFEFDASVEQSGGAGQPFDSLMIVTFEVEDESGAVDYLTYFVTD